MDKYSRINSKGKSQSRRFSDLSFPISTQLSKPHEEKTNNNEYLSEKPINSDGIIQDQENAEEVDGEMFGVILSRSRSVPFYKSMAEKELTPSEERTACSMKKSSSVSSGGGYSRIHHQIYDDEAEYLNFLQRKHGVKHKGKFLRACMRLFRFN